MGNSSGFHSMVPLLRAAEVSSLGGRPAGIGAFNVNFYTQATGIIEGLRRTEAPGIIQASKGANKFQGGPDKIAYMVRKAMQASNHPFPIALHLDHGDEETAKACVDQGYSSVMIDLSKLDYEDNIAKTKEMVEYAHRKGASVEGEYGKLQGVEEDIVHEMTTKYDNYLVPNFFDKSGADALATAYGTSHGPNKGAGLEKLAIYIVDESYKGLVAYRRNLKNFLVGHGSSTVPAELIEEINSYGGHIEDARGIPMEKILEAIKSGIRKINIDTDLRLAITATFRKYFHDNPGVEKTSKDILLPVKKALGENPGVIDPREYLGVLDRTILREEPKGTDLEEIMGLVHERVASHVAMLVEKFGSDGLAPRVENIGLDYMIEVYKG